MLIPRVLFLYSFRKDEEYGKRVCGLWRGLLYRHLRVKVHNHQLCVRHQDWETVEPQHSVHQSVRLQLHGGLQPQTKSALRLGQQESGHLSHHL